MPSTNKTKLGFNQWFPTDKPKMADFNADNTLADQLLGERYTKTEADGKFAPVSAGITAEERINLADALLKTAGGTVSGLTNFTGGLQINNRPVAGVESGIWEPTGPTFEFATAYATYCIVGYIVLGNLSVQVSSILDQNGGAYFEGLPFAASRVGSGNLIRSNVFAGLNDIRVRVAGTSLEFMGEGSRAVKGSECKTGLIEATFYYMI